jgi:glycosyltransferase involved in cell wall biosynthesis
LAGKLGIESRVRFLDPLPEELYPAIYHCADLFVLPSIERTEAFGIVGLEAMAAGLPIITTELGTGTTYYNNDDRRGEKIPPKSIEALEYCLRRCFSFNLPDRKSFYPIGKSFIMNFSLSVVVLRYIKDAYLLKMKGENCNTKWRLNDGQNWHNPSSSIKLI